MLSGSSLCLAKSRKSKIYTPNLRCNTAMGRRRKNRTHLKDTTTTSKDIESAPKTFVIKHGHVGTSLAQLVRDLRKVMEPNTASRLRVSSSPLSFVSSRVLDSR